jgi:hypothetical protein
MKTWRRWFVIACLVAGVALVAALPIAFLSLVYTEFLDDRMGRGMPKAQVDRMLFPAWAEKLDAEAILAGKKYNPPECEQIVTYWIFGMHPIDVGFTSEKKVLYAFPTYE